MPTPIRSKVRPTFPPDLSSSKIPQDQHNQEPLKLNYKKASKFTECASCASSQGRSGKRRGKGGIPHDLSAATSAWYRYAPVSEGFLRPVESDTFVRSRPRVGRRLANQTRAPATKAPASLKTAQCQKTVLWIASELCWRDLRPRRRRDRGAGPVREA